MIRISQEEWSVQLVRRRQERNIQRFIASIRNGEKVEQHIVCYFGVAMIEAELMKMKELADFFRDGFGAESSPNLLRSDELVCVTFEG
jgi:hypothetical protein